MSVNTRELLVEEGGFLYDSECYNDDIPYWTKIGDKAHLVVPYDLVVNDCRFVLSQGYGSPEHFLEYAKATLNRLLHDGDDTSRMMSARAAFPLQRTSRAGRRCRPLHRVCAVPGQRVDRHSRRHRRKLRGAGEAKLLTAQRPAPGNYEPTEPGVTHDQTSGYPHALCRPETRADTRTATSREGDVPEIAEQTETLQEAITDDFTTGIVPLAKRQPTWHLQALMMNFWAGFSYVLVGFTLNEAGYTLLKSTLIILLGTAIYWVYGTAAAWIGARTGQTHALLSRSIFGVCGSVLVSLVIVFAQIGWVGFQGNLTVQIWSGLFGWGHVLLIGVVLTIAMITNNVLGFTGVATFARYIVAPLMFAWLMYLVIKAFTTEGSSVLAGPPACDRPHGLPGCDHGSYRVHHVG